MSSSLLSELEYNDTSLTPYTEYEYTISAVNDFGSVRSPVARIRTPAGTPSGDITLQVSDITTISASFSWNQPTSANGQILKYQLTSTTSSQPSTVIHYEGLGMSVRLTDLTAYTYYLFRISACTAGGCLTSEVSPVLTERDYPDGQMPPNITAISPTQLLVTWEPPLFPNGEFMFLTTSTHTYQTPSSWGPISTLTFLTFQSLIPKQYVETYSVMLQVFFQSVSVKAFLLFLSPRHHHLLRTMDAWRDKLRRSSRPRG